MLITHFYICKLNSLHINLPSKISFLFEYDMIIMYNYINQLTRIVMSLVYDWTKLSNEIYSAHKMFSSRDHNLVYMKEYIYLL